MDNNTSNQPLLDGYRWYGHCRNIKHIRSKLTYGGIGLFIKESLFDTYNISVLDKSYEGILCLLLRDKISEFTFTVYCCYLAPEQSPYGRNSAGFYNHLLSLMYLHNFVDASFCLGDFNGRISDKSDIINAVDDECATRNVIDSGHNQHGDALLDFLIESRMVVTNGRIPLGSNNFTSISSRGSAVVDYIAVPHENMVNCSYFNVDTMSEILSKYNLESMLSTTCKAPDHSLLSLKYSIYQDTSDDTSDGDEHRSEESLFKKYNYGTMSSEFMNSPSWVAILDDLISRIECSSKSQAKVDELYDGMLYSQKWMHILSTAMPLNIHVNIIKIINLSGILILLIHGKRWSKLKRCLQIAYGIPACLKAFGKIIYQNVRFSISYYARLKDNIIEIKL